MRCGWAGAIVVLASCGAASAQDLGQGPLTEPGTSAKQAPSPHRRTPRSHHAAANKGTDLDRPSAEPVVRKDPPSRPADPLSLGMKWNGSNDDSRETRTQNYNGGAAGAGAEVGLKLHF